MGLLELPSQGGIITLTVCFTVIIVGAVAARLHSRRSDGIPLGYDDGFVVVASFLFFGVYTVPMIIAAASAGLGKKRDIYPSGPIPDLPSQQFANIQFLLTNFHVLVLGCARCSILCLYKRIFIGRPFAIVFYIMGTYEALWTIAFFFAFLFHCTPIQAQAIWQLQVHGNPKCENIIKISEALCISSAISDFLALAVPLPFLWNLQMRKGLKIAVAFVFLLGNLTLLASVGRVVLFFQIYHVATASPHPELLDMMYEYGIQDVLAETNSAMAIICSCLPTLGHWLRRGLGRGASPLTTSTDWRARLKGLRHPSHSGSYQRWTGSDEFPMDPLTGKRREALAKGTSTHWDGEEEVGKDRIYVRRDIETEVEIVERREVEVVRMGDMF